MSEIYRTEPPEDFGVASEHDRLAEASGDYYVARAGFAGLALLSGIIGAADFGGAYTTGVHRPVEVAVAVVTAIAAGTGAFWSHLQYRRTEAARSSVAINLAAQSPFDW